MKKLALVFVLFGLLMPLSALAQEGQKVAVTPVNFIAEGAQLEQLSRVSKGLLSVITESFANQGFTPLTMGDNVLASGEDAAKANAKQLGADYIFISQASKSGDRFSLSGTLVALSGGKSSPRVNVTANALENLPQTAERLVLMSTDHLFGGGAKVVSVQIVGSESIDQQAILHSLRIRVGGTYNDAKASSDLRRIHSMGIFEDVRVEAADVGGGKAVKFIVSERAQIGQIAFKGNEKFDDEDLQDVITIKQYDIPSNRAVQDSVEALKRFYSSKGYPTVQIYPEFSQGDAGKSVLTYSIEEGGRLYISDILFDGNDYYSAWTLSGKIDSTSRGLFSWLSGTGKLDREKLSNDSQKLLSFYHNNGFMQAQVGEPVIDMDEEGGGFIITFPIMEGPRFRVGEVTLGGQLLPDDDPEKLVKKVELRNEKWFNREMLQEDLKNLKNYYSDLGYAHNQVEPNVFPAGDEDNSLNVELVINPGEKVYFDRITIVGNQKTRDKVIRRHLAVSEGDQFTSTGLQDSQSTLMRSGFFDEVNMVPGPSDSPDEMNLRVEVKERPTGSFQIGAGYSNYNSIFGVARVTQDNLFGYGRRLSLEANVGSNSTMYDLSYTDPWVGDIPLSLGVDLFNYETSYDNYDKNSIGGALRAGYPLWGKFYLSGRYSLENVKIDNVRTGTASVIRDMGGKYIDSIFTASIRRDTRNHFFQPSAGTLSRLTYSLGSGLFNGDTHFSRYEAEAAVWIPTPILKGSSFMVHGEIGYVKENKQDGLPLYEKYMLGGINSVRGYDWFSISPRDPLTGDEIGGEKMMVFNLELAFPILQESGLYFVTFFDMGNVWEKSSQYDFSDLRKSYGAGIRYLSPLGPFRVEYGRALDPYPGDPKGRWEFTMGTMF